jgi:hypothetical protein
MTPEQRAKHLRTIEKIENMKRPEKWRAIRKFLLEVRPDLAAVEKGHCDACKEIRQATESGTAASKQGDIRNTMKIPEFIYQVLCKYDPELMIEMSGRNKGLQVLIAKQLWEAFPDYRIARKF